jgi:hypothetical protein
MTARHDARSRLLVDSAHHRWLVVTNAPLTFLETVK